MKILTVSHFFESHGGGIERVAGQLVREFAAAGHLSTWAASDCDPPPETLDISVTRLPCINPIERLTGLPMPIPGPKGLRQLHTAIANSDLVILHDALYATSIAALMLARHKGKPSVVVQHIAAIPFRSRVLRSLMTLANKLVTAPALRSADQVVFISDTVRRDLAHVGLRRPARLLFNGVDSGLFYPGNARRADFGLSHATRVAVFVGRFVEKKGLNVLNEVARMRPDVTFALAGSGPIDPRSWKLDNVLCLGKLPPHRMAELYRCGDLLLLPSVGEGYPLVIQEAMACALPVICSRESAIADPGAAGYLTGVDIDLNRPAETAAAIVPLLDIRPDSSHLAQMAAYASKAYSWPAMAAEITRIGLSLKP